MIYNEQKMKEVIPSDRQLDKFDEISSPKACGIQPFFAMHTHF